MKSFYLLKSIICVYTRFTTLLWRILSKYLFSLRSKINSENGVTYQTVHKSIETFFPFLYLFPGSFLKSHTLIHAIDHLLVRDHYYLFYYIMYYTDIFFFMMLSSKLKRRLFTVGSLVIYVYVTISRYIITQVQM